METFPGIKECCGPLPLPSSSLPSSSSWWIGDAGDGGFFMNSVGSVDDGCLGCEFIYLSLYRKPLETLHPPPPTLISRNWGCEKNCKKLEKYEKKTLGEKPGMLSMRSSQNRYIWHLCPKPKEKKRRTESVDDHHHDHDDLIIIIIITTMLVVMMIKGKHSI